MLEGHTHRGGTPVGFECRVVPHRADDRVRHPRDRSLQHPCPGTTHPPYSLRFPRNDVADPQTDRASFQLIFEDVAGLLEQAGGVEGGNVSVWVPPSRCCRAYPCRYRRVTAVRGISRSAGFDMVPCEDPQPTGIGRQITSQSDFRGQVCHVHHEPPSRRRALMFSLGPIGLMRSHVDVARFELAASSLRTKRSSS